MTDIPRDGAPGAGARDALTTLEGPDILAWVGLSTQGLREKKSEINRLNVFPIPDSDTGSNMAYTMTAAYEAALGVDISNPAHVADVTAALASGAVRGARGNSGVMISQVMRALASVSARGSIDATAVAAMLQLAEQLVRTAVSDPVEGTLLTVLRAASDAAGEVAEAGRPLIATALAARDAAEQALDDTPSQLPALAEAGVVDAGGTGLVVILDALCRVIAGDTDMVAQPVPAAAEDSVDFADSAAAEQSVLVRPRREISGKATGQNRGAVTGEIEVMFFFTAPGDNPEDAVEKLKALTAEMGNSVVIGAVDDRNMAVHVHTRRGGELIEAAFSLGEVTDLRLEALVTSQPPETNVLAPQPVVALVPEGAAEQWFRSVGAVPLSSDEPEAIEDALRQAGGGPLAVLTNGQPAGRLIHGYSGVEFTVIDSGSLVGGMAAMAVYDIGAELEDNIDEMIDAASSQRCTHAAVDGLLDTLNACIDDAELVTVLYSHAEHEPQVVAAIQALEQLYPDLEFYSYHLEGLTFNGEPVEVEIGVE